MTPLRHRWRMGAVPLAYRRSFARALLCWRRTHRHQLRRGRRIPWRPQSREGTLLQAGVVWFCHLLKGSGSFGDQIDSNNLASRNVDTAFGLGALAKPPNSILVLFD